MGIIVQEGSPISPNHIYYIYIYVYINIIILYHLKCEFKTPLCHPIEIPPFHRFFSSIFPGKVRHAWRTEALSVPGELGAEDHNYGNYPGLIWWTHRQWIYNPPWTNKRETNLDLLPNPPGYTETQIRSTVVQSRSGFDTPQNHWPLAATTPDVSAHATCRLGRSRASWAGLTKCNLWILHHWNQQNQTNFFLSWCCCSEEKKWTWRESKEGAFSFIFSLIFTWLSSQPRIQSNSM